MTEQERRIEYIMIKSKAYLRIAENLHDTIYNLDKLIRKDFKQMNERLEDSKPEEHEFILNFYFKMINGSFERSQWHILNYSGEINDS